LEDKRQTSSEEAQQRAAEWGMQYVETSAKTRQNVDKIFYEVMRLIRTRKQEKTKQQTGKKKENSSKKKKKCAVL
jgi:GTPase SAR1 family protein